MLTHGDSQCTHGDSEIIVHSKIVIINLNGPSASIMHSKMVVMNIIWLQLRDFGIFVCLSTPHFSNIFIFYLAAFAEVPVPHGHSFHPPRAAIWCLMNSSPPQSKSSLPCGRRAVQAGSSYVPLAKPLAPA